MAECLFQADGTGFFSRAWCTGCDWVAKKQPPEELHRLWERHHESGSVTKLPSRAPLHPVAEGEQVQQIEREIIQALAYQVDRDDPKVRAHTFIAYGLSRARSILLDQKPVESSEYVADMTARVASLSKRQRQKLCSPTIDRHAQQHVLENG